jgi:hypothetical protein
VRFAPGVTFTRLPYGGAVLVNATTLALTECGESEAVLVEHLLTHGVPVTEETPRSRPAPGSSPVPPPASLRRMAKELIESGWLLDDRRT